MYTLQINTLINKCTLLKWVFRGIYPRDKLPKRLPKRTKYIVNFNRQTWTRRKPLDCDIHSTK